ncbi:hypothetical protein [Metabacillus fastidiosus]|uniref:hypothetical protein n=1 Tax=Metabacillus fastidiosus TaxID=1458 RepID=UPI003D28B013
MNDQIEIVAAHKLILNLYHIDGLSITEIERVSPFNKDEINRIIEMYKDFKEIVYYKGGG